MSENDLILYVDGVSGVLEIFFIDTFSGITGRWAYTTDATFTRPIRPVGIAVSRDGLWCFIADASMGRIVRIPYANSSPIIDTFGGYGSWQFVDPCAMDAADDDLVFVSDTGSLGYPLIAYTWGRYASYVYVNTSPAIATSLEIDWDVSYYTPTYALWPIWNVIPTAEAYNRNRIEPSPNQHNLGGIIEGAANGKLYLYRYS